MVAGLTDATAIAAGPFMTCAIRGSQREVTCWGADAPEPVTVAGLSNVTQVAVGAHHACVVLDSGGVRCWGNNNRGQLGDGTVDNRVSPGPVSGLP